ncbi:hypothetical protein DNTS_023468 [Danionella cerebrum]|uniref:Cyclic AMP-responsive element-binding protein 3-like protein 4 n=1 Tax=Danionella cerebrum TaxID=2873325 RepID=A0A553R9I3_9TELE|nr:hypothetical protein DNTS_023468 [Danionella translucida]
MREYDCVSQELKTTETDGGPLSPCSGVVFPALDLETHAQTWSVHAPSPVMDSDSDEVLPAMNPNAMYSSTLTENVSDPGTAPQEGVACQLIYDIISQEPETTQQGVDVISIELDEWSSQLLLSQSCVVNELKMENMPDHEAQEEGFLGFPELQLTEEEQKLLDQEGISLPNNLPLTKAEERILKRVRRKIRNKLSAQDSRRRKKEYIDGLESRAAACSAQNQELQRTVDQLEKRNMSLVAQLQRLQTLIKQTATKAAQTSTCIMILFFSLVLLIFPSVNPFRRGSESLQMDSFAPHAGISRNILNDAAASAILEDSVLQEEAVYVFSEQKEADSSDLDSTEMLRKLDDIPIAPGSGFEAKNETNKKEGETIALLLTEDKPDANKLTEAPKETRPSDAVKQTHAEEM